MTIRYFIFISLFILSFDSFGSTELYYASKWKLFIERNIEENYFVFHESYFPKEPCNYVLDTLRYSNKEKLFSGTKYRMHLVNENELSISMINKKRAHFKVIFSLSSDMESSQLKNNYWFSLNSSKFNSLYCNRIHTSLVEQRDSLRTKLDLIKSRLNFYSSPSTFNSQLESALESVP